jgi:2-phosphoxylose phosphatase
MFQPTGVDSLEPQYSCPGGSNLFNTIRSGANWTDHLTAARPLYATLDSISGINPNDAGWHNTLDHYYDNLSARQCHSKPLPCKIVDGPNSTNCITQELTDQVYRLGHYEYSYFYRDDPRTLSASVATYGVWIAELAANIRGLIDGKTDIIYRHNVAHDGSMSRLLSILQLDQMVWPGMGSEVVFEVYKKEKPTSTTTPTTLVTATPTIVALNCNRDNCLRQFIQETSAVSSFCPTYTVSSFNGPLPTFVSACGGLASRVSSACSCVVTSTTSVPTSTPTPPASNSGHYVRVLWGGQVLRSSNPSLGLMNMLPLETLLAYFDGLVGKDASLVRGKCGV